MSKFISNYFELIPNDRKKRLKDKESIQIPILEVFNKKKLPLKNYITYFFLSTIAFILKNIILIYRKFLRKSN